MNHIFRAVLCFWLSISAFAQPNEQAQPRDQWGAPTANVSRANAIWTIAGRKQSVSLNETNFTIEIHAGPATWAMVASSTLQKRLAFMEMTKHEFLDPEYRKERTTFVDVTTVTVDWNAKSVTVRPDLN